MLKFWIVVVAIVWIIVLVSKVAMVIRPDIATCPIVDLWECIDKGSGYEMRYH